MSSTFDNIKTVASLGILAWSIYEELNKPDTPPKNSLKGTEASLDTKTTYLPIVYGRGRVTATPVYATSGSKFLGSVARDSLPSKVFEAYSPASGTFTDTVTVEGQPPIVTSLQSIPAVRLTTTMPSGDFLFVQYAIAKGEIHNAVECIVDDKYISDPVLGSRPYAKWDIDGKSRAALRIDVNYNGGKNDLFVRNCPKRGTALFPGVAYASAVFKIDPVQPQFDNIPTLEVMLEGRRIKAPGPNEAYDNNSIKYSNNPAWVLLDYLLLDDSSLSYDIASFKAAAAICDTPISMSGVLEHSRGGRFYHPSNDLPPTTNNTSLATYECNLVLDTSQPKSTNIKKILETMPDAVLSWTDGQYKLLLNNDENFVITEDDLILSQEVEFVYPSSDHKYNYCTVKYKNESLEFEEDSVSWPPKTTDDTPYTPVGNVKFGRSVKTNWGDDNSGANAVLEVLNTASIWQGNSTAASFQFWVQVPSYLAGTYRLTGGATGEGTITLTRYTNPTASGVGDPPVAFSGGSLITDVILPEGYYKILVNITSSAVDALDRGVAARLVGAGEENNAIELWKTTDETPTDYITTPTNSNKYQDYMTADGGVESEKEVSVDGITDYFHAAFLAKTIVEKSRAAFIVNFSFIVRNKLPEPGDIVYLGATPELSLNDDLRLRVISSAMDLNNICKISAEYAPVVSLTISEFISSVPAVSISDTFYASPPINVVAVEQTDGSVKLTWEGDDLDGAYQIFALDELDGLTLLMSGVTSRTVIISNSRAVNTRYLVRASRKNGQLTTPAISNRVTKTPPVSLVSSSVPYVTTDDTGNLTPTSITLLGPDPLATYRWYINGVLQTAQIDYQLITPSLPQESTIKMVWTKDGITQQDELVIPYRVKGASAYALELSDYYIPVRYDSDHNIVSTPFPEDIDVTLIAGTTEVPKSYFRVALMSQDCSASWVAPQLRVTGLTTPMTSGSVTVTVHKCLAGETAADGTVRTTDAPVLSFAPLARKVKIESTKDGEKGQGQVKGICFLRTDSTVIPITPAGGTYESPTATGWFDGIPAGSGRLWQTTRIFTSDTLAPQQAFWSTPSPVANDNAHGFQFSLDNVNWSNTASVDSLYMRSWTSIDGGTIKTYTGGVLIKGERGADSTVPGPKGDASTVPGPKGDQGNIAIRAYAQYSNATSDISFTPDAGVQTKTMPGQTIPTTTGTATSAWSLLPVALISGSKQFQMDGIYNPAATSTVWTQPYLSLFKVDTLEAITANVGSLTSGISSKRLTINEKDAQGTPSHEFRAYYNGGEVASVGVKDADNTVVSVNLSYAYNDVSAFYVRQPTNSIYSNAFQCYASGTPPVGAANYGNLILGRRTAARWEGLWAQNLNAVNGAQSSVLLATDTFGGQFTHNPSNSLAVLANADSAGSFTNNTRSVVICDNTNAVKATGDIVATGDIKGFSTSDKTLKTNLVKIHNPIEKLMKLAGYHFTWKKKFLKKKDKAWDRNDVGVIAQEVLEVLPEAVDMREDGTLAVDYTKLIPLLIEVAKAQQLQIEELRRGLAK